MTGRFKVSIRHARDANWVERLLGGAVHWDVTDTTPPCGLRTRGPSPRPLPWCIARGMSRNAAAADRAARRALARYLRDEDRSGNDTTYEVDT